MSDTTTLVLDQHGVLAAAPLGADAIVFYLTGCCRADAKGSANSPTGVCCRSCYRPVPAELGAGWLASDAASWQRWTAAFEAYYANPTPTGEAIITELVERTIAGARAVAGSAA